MIHHCNSAAKLAALQKEGLYIPFFLCSGFGFSHLVELQSFVLHLISGYTFLPCSPVIAQCLQVQINGGSS